LTLGIPGGATSAILLVAVTLQGLRPGPMLFTSNPELIWGFFMGLLVGAGMATVLYLVMIPWFALITIVRIELLAPMLLIITLFGADANERNVMDVFVAIVFGLLGHFLRRHGYPLISLVIGLILGKLAEGSFHQALMISDHDYSVFILRPLSATIFAICLVLALLHTRPQHQHEADREDRRRQRPQDEYRVVVVGNHQRLVERALGELAENEADDQADQRIAVPAQEMAEQAEQDRDEHVHDVALVG